MLCERGDNSRPVVFEVELPETLVRRETVRRLGALIHGELDTRLVVIADDDDHAHTIRHTEHLLHTVGLSIPVAALAPDSEVLTGADW